MVTALLHTQRQAEGSAAPPHGHSPATQSGPDAEIKTERTVSTEVVPLQYPILLHTIAKTRGKTELPAQRPTKSPILLNMIVKMLNRNRTVSTQAGQNYSCVVVHSGKDDV